MIVEKVGEGSFAHVETGMGAGTIKRGFRERQADLGQPD
jgi:hypothetical protein